MERNSKNICKLHITHDRLIDYARTPFHSHTFFFYISFNIVAKIHLKIKKWFCGYSCSIKALIAFLKNPFMPLNSSCVITFLVSRIVVVSRGLMSVPSAQHWSALDVVIPMYIYHSRILRRNKWNTATAWGALLLR